MMAAIHLGLFLMLLQNAPPPPPPDIALTVACGSRPNEVALTILNQSGSDTAVLLGYAFGNGAQYFPRELVVEIKRAAGADFEPLLFAGPGGIAAGRMDHWILTLPARAAFTLPLRATDFSANTPGFNTLTAPPAELRVKLTGRSITADLSLDMSGVQLWRLWQGTAVSNSLRLAAECGR